MEGSKNSLANLDSSGPYSNFRIRCKGSFFPVHLALSQDLEALERKIKHVNYHTESAAEQYEIDMDEEQLVAVAALTRYLYTHDYNDHGQITGEIDLWSYHLHGTANSDSETPISHTCAQYSGPPAGYDLGKIQNPVEMHPILINTLVHLLAKKYHIIALQDLSLKKYRTAVEKEWDVDNFIMSLDIMYTASADCLKEVAILVAHDHIDSLLSKRRFQRLLRKNGDIGLDILKALAVGNERESTQSVNVPSMNHLADPKPILNAPPTKSLSKAFKKQLRKISKAISLTPQSSSTTAEAASEKTEFDEKRYFGISETDRTSDMSIPNSPPATRKTRTLWSAVTSKKFKKCKRKSKLVDEANTAPEAEEAEETRYYCNLMKKIIGEFREWKRKKSQKRCRNVGTKDYVETCSKMFEIPVFVWWMIM